MSESDPTVDLYVHLGSYRGKGVLCVCVCVCACVRVWVWVCVGGSIVGLYVCDLGVGCLGQ